MSAPGTSSRALARPEPHEGIASLSWPSFGISLTIVLAIFFVLNPLWEPIDMAQVDQNILWSYAPIPLLVLVFLALERKLRVSAFLVETLRLTLVKFSITYLVAHILWVLTGAPPSHAPPPDPATSLAATAPPIVHQAPVDSAIDPALTGSLSGVVLGPRGTPLPGALVWVSDGLQPHTFAPPAETVEIRNDGRGFVPDLVVVHAFQPLTLHSANGVLHTVSATDDTGRRVFNYPVSPTSQRALVFERAHGLLTLACEVHREREPNAHAVVVSNPYFARTGSDGRFAFAGVPEGELELSAWIPTGEVVVTRATVRAGADTSLRLERR